MKNVIIIVVLTITELLTAQTNYDKGMQKAFQLWGSDPVEASNLFERIATAEPDNWLPLYYISAECFLRINSILLLFQHQHTFWVSYQN